MTRTVLLARPHPFIVSEMKPFLESSGFKVSTPNDLSALSQQETGASGAIISLALVSTISESANVVFVALRNRHPKLPVVFAGLVDFTAMLTTLERMGEAAGFNPVLLGADTKHVDHPSLGMERTFLYLSKADLTEPTRRATAGKLIERHFK